MEKIRRLGATVRLTPGPPAILVPSMHEEKMPYSYLTNIWGHCASQQPAYNKLVYVPGKVVQY